MQYGNESVPPYGRNTPDKPSLTKKRDEQDDSDDGWGTVGEERFNEINEVNEIQQPDDDLFSFL